jgi:hypothetical protein
MVRSLRTTARFFHQRVAEDAESLQERLALVRRERAQRPRERLVPPLEPCSHLLRRERVQVDDRAPPVILVLPAVDELVVLEVACELARGRQRQAELRGDLTDRPLALRRDVGEDGDVPRAERRAAADEREQLRGRPAADPQPAEDAAQEQAKLGDLSSNSYH